MREFLALPLPESLRRAVVHAGSFLAASGRDWRFVRDEGLHVTIRFLGEVDPERHPELDLAWGEAARGVGPIDLRLGGITMLPSPSRPRVVCLSVLDVSPDGRLARLAARMEQAARGQGFAPELRPFAGHVTLARARRLARVATTHVASSIEAGAFVAKRVVLYSSEPDRGGSRYLERASYPLDPGSG